MCFVLLVCAEPHVRVVFEWVGFKELCCILVLYPSDLDLLIARVFSLEFFNSLEGIVAVRAAVEMEGEDFFHNVYPFIYLVRVCSIIKNIFWL